MIIWGRDPRQTSRVTAWALLALLVTLWALSARLTAAPQRTYLTAPYWIVVSPGEDATMRIAHAQRTLDTAGWSLIVVLQPGSHGTICVSGPFLGNGRVTITGGPGVTVTGIVAQAGATITIQALRIVAPSAAVAAVDKAWIDLGDGLDFGPAGAEHLVASYGSVIYARTSAYTVSGGAVSHAHAYGRASIVLPEPLVITVTEPVTFGAYVYGAAIGDIHARARWTGAGVSTPQRRALIHFASLLYAAGVVVPGDGPLTVDPDSVFVE